MDTLRTSRSNASWPMPRYRSHISIESVSLSRPSPSAEVGVRLSAAIRGEAGPAGPDSGLSVSANIRLAMRPVVNREADTAQKSQNDQHFGNIERAHDFSPALNYSPLCNGKEMKFGPQYPNRRFLAGSGGPARSGKDGQPPTPPA